MGRFKVLGRALIERAALPVGLGCGIGVLLFALQLSAETTDFGGTADKFKGVGDRVPPRCQIDVPRAATQSFFIAWNCIDDAAEPDEIVSELWIYRKGAPAARKVVDFLGFPASVQIDEAILQSATVAEGLPAGFRLVARDRAGIAAISPVFTVLNQDNSVARCDLSITTQATEADGGTTGVPALNVMIANAEVASQQNGNNDLQLASIMPVTASPCEILELCEPDDENRVQFSAALSIQSGTDSNELAGRLTLNNGELSLNVRGSGRLSGAMLSSFTVSGETIIDGVPAEAVLSCGS